MKRILNVALKDLLLNFRDPIGLVLMLLAPLALTLVIASALGGGGGNNSGLQNIPVVLVNHDAGQMSQYLVQAFSSDELASLVEPVSMDDETAARALVDQDKAAAAVIIPQNFSESIMPQASQEGGSQPAATSTSKVEVYSNPSRSISASIIRSIVDQVLNQFNMGRAGGQVIVMQLISSGRLSVKDAPHYGAQLGTRLAENPQAAAATLEVTMNGEAQSEEFSWLEYSAPSMAILFLMFSLTTAGRTLLVERDHGTLPRMLVSPSSRAEILGGKMLGTFLTGLLQMFILLVAGHFLFKISWGNPWAVLLLTLSLVAAISGWGMLPAAFSRTSGQAATLGTMITLLFSALSGTFVPRGALPGWLQNISLVTPNAWGNEWYYRLIRGASFSEVLPAVVVLSVMAVLLLGISILAFRRQYN